jgi:hypothetical protein
MNVRLIAALIISASATLALFDPATAQTRDTSASAKSKTQRAGPKSVVKKQRVPASSSSVVAKPQAAPPAVYDEYAR